MTFDEAYAYADEYTHTVGDYDKPLWQACVDLSSIVVVNVNEGHIYER